MDKKLMINKIKSFVKTNFKYIKSDQSGQALLLVIVSLTVALAVVTSISVRNLSSISRIAQTDSSYRVSAAAEGGAERFLSLSNAQLFNIASDASSSSCSSAGVTYDSGSDKCTVAFPGTSGDNINSLAYVSVSIYPSGPSMNLTVNKDETYEIALNTYSANTINVYWKASSGTVQPAVFLLGYTGTMSGTQVWKQLYCPNSGCSATLADSVTGAPSGTATSGVYTNGVSGISTQISGVSMYGLRILVLGADADIRVESSGGATIPQQGYIIESVGELSTNSSVTATSTTSVFKSYTFLPSMFDFAIYNNGAALP